MYSRIIRTRKRVAKGKRKSRFHWAWFCDICDDAKLLHSNRHPYAWVHRWLCRTSERTLRLKARWHQRAAVSILWYIVHCTSTRSTSTRSTTLHMGMHICMGRGPVDPLCVSCVIHSAPKFSARKEKSAPMKSQFLDAKSTFWKQWARSNFVTATQIWEVGKGKQLLWSCSGLHFLECHMLCLIYDQYSLETQSCSWLKR
jgi:hypothetical protein